MTTYYLFERIDSGNMCLILSDRKMYQLQTSIVVDPKMAAKTSFENILEQIQSFNLNFQLQQFASKSPLSKTEMEFHFCNLKHPPPVFLNPSFQKSQFLLSLTKSLRLISLSSRTIMILVLQNIKQL